MSRTRLAMLAGIIGVTVMVIAACGSASSRSTAGTPLATASDPAAVFRDRFGATWPKTDFTRHSVDPSEIISGGPGKDGIPSIDHPTFIKADEAASFLSEQEPVIVVDVNRDARAYPVQILIWHEIVNDTVGGVPLTITYCPLCNSAIAFKRELNGITHDFGVSGLLRNSDLIMYDRQTESWWQQFTGEAIAGALTGTSLDLAPASTISFADFRSTYPNSLVLSRHTGFSRPYGANPYAGYDTSNRPFLFTGKPDRRLHPAERVVAVEMNGGSVAYPFSTLAGRRVVEDTVGGTAIVVFFQPGAKSALDASSIADSRNVGASGVFRPEAGGRTLTFRFADGKIKDDQTGSTWNIAGKAVGGPLAGMELAPVIHGDYFWFAWAAFKPDTRIWVP